MKTALRAAAFILICVSALAAEELAVQVERNVAATMRDGVVLRADRWAYLQYAEDASQGIELFDIGQRPEAIHEPRREA